MSEQPFQSPSACNVLLVDDDESGIWVLRECVEALPGVNAVSTSSGHEALKLIASSHVDLVITDLFMPGTDGLEVIAEAKARRIPAILVTVMAPDEAFFRQQPRYRPDIVFIKGAREDEPYGRAFGRSALQEEAIRLLRIGK